jgi:Zn-finger nucleic acid-binding protein
MRTYERSDVTVDQCTECRGIFLDRGELERLIDAEAAWAARQPEAHPQGPPAPPRAEPPYQQPQYGDREKEYDERRKGPYKKRRSFLEDLFD